MALALFADGRREHIVAWRQGGVFIVRDGLFSQQQIDDMRVDLATSRSPYVERVLRWKMYATPEQCYGPLESAEWKWESGSGPGMFRRVEWILVEDGAPRCA